MRQLFTVLLVAVGFSAAHADNVNLEDVSLSDLLNIKIESASKQAEPWAEAPVPVSVITKDMIKMSGVRTVQEALIYFVPGYTDADDRNELVFATRGIYGTSQQKVLIMINGHRINSRSYLSAMPDYGMAIHQLERIEVLRGPGSSLYGNVALAGVVNLITKKGKDVKTSAEVAGGNWGQQRARFLTGAGNDDWDFLGWGQYYKASGEVHQLDGNEKYVTTGDTGRILIDGVDKPAAHDFGMTFKKGNWTFFAADRQSSWIEPYGGNRTYDYDSYRTFNEQGPGLAMSQQHLGAKYNKDLGSNWSFEFNPYFDHSTIAGEVATSTNGGNAITWADQNLGFITQGSMTYGEGSNLLVGAQVEAFEVTDSMRMTMTNGEFTAFPDTKATPLLSLGGESNYSAFVQDKHKFNSKWILNGGLRYDYKNRKSGDSYDNVSPRVALIHLPSDAWEFKLSYSESFVDGPYWYRYNNFNTFRGDELLSPEIMKAAQFQTVWKSSDKRLRNAATLFYQKANDLVILDSTATGAVGDPRYKNSGSIESMGLENEFAWLETKYQIFWNLTYQKALSSAVYSAIGDKFAHVPTYASDVVFNYMFGKGISANATIQYIGEQVYNNGTLTNVTSKGVDAATLFHLGGRYEDIARTGMFMDARVYNVADTTHYQGGQSGTQIPFRQAGRWWLVSVGTEF